MPRIALSLITAGLVLTASCKKSDQIEERWLETSQRQEVIVFKNGTPSDNGEERSFYFQSRKLPPEVSRASESGLYFYTLSGDSLILRSRDKKFYFKMTPDGKSFVIGRFFQSPGLPEKLVFEKQ